MAGYRTIPEAVARTYVDDVRIAEEMQRAGDIIGAPAKFEALLAAFEAQSPIVPGWLCGRLATLYRRLARYDDEVVLLERYEATQVTDETRARYTARLSKARAIASKRKKQTASALLSIRTVYQRRLLAMRSGGDAVSSRPVYRSDYQLPDARAGAHAGNDHRSR